MLNLNSLITKTMEQEEEIKIMEAKLKELRLQNKKPLLHGGDTFSHIIQRGLYWDRFHGFILSATQPSYFYKTRRFPLTLS